jgi:hypothetical protein
LSHDWKNEFKTAALCCAIVIPAQAGIQGSMRPFLHLDSRLRGNDRRVYYPQTAIVDQNGSCDSQSAQAKLIMTKAVKKIYISHTAACSCRCEITPFQAGNEPNFS